MCYRVALLRNLEIVDLRNHRQDYFAQPRHHRAAKKADELSALCINLPLPPSHSQRSRRASSYIRYLVRHLTVLRVDCNLRASVSSRVRPCAQQILPVPGRNPRPINILSHHGGRHGVLRCFGCPADSYRARDQESVSEARNHYTSRSALDLQVLTSMFTNFEQIRIQATRQPMPAFKRLEKPIKYSPTKTLEHSMTSSAKSRPCLRLASKILQSSSA